MLIRNSMFHPYPPRLRFNGTVTPPEGTPGAVPPGQETPPEGEQPSSTDLGFPADTPIADMTDKEQAAYYKHHSRRHESVAKSRADYDAMKRDSEELAKLRAADLAANQTAEEKAIEDARREGEQKGSDRYLLAAIVGRLSALTGKNDDELAATLELIDVQKFKQDDGELAVEKINAFAATIGMKAAPEPTTPATDPVKDALERQKNGDQHRGSGSIAELTKLALDALTPPTK